MGLAATFGNQLLAHIFLNAAITLIGDATGLPSAGAAGSLYVSLHTADPAAGDQTTSEASFGGYARVAVARTSGGWTVSGLNVVNAADILFAAASSGTATITHIGIGTSSSGTGKLLYSVPVGTSVQGPFTAKADDTITIPGHSFVVDDRVAFYAAAGSSLPTGITAGTAYWVKTVSGADITISATQGGATLDITAIGDGVAYKAATLAVSTSIAPKITAGTLSLTLS